MKRLLLAVLLAVLPFSAHALTESALLTQLQGAYDGGVSTPQQIICIDGLDRCVYEVRAYRIDGNVLREERIQYFRNEAATEAWYRATPSQIVVTPPPGPLNEIQAYAANAVAGGAVKGATMVWVQQVTDNRLVTGWNVVLNDKVQIAALIYRAEDGTITHEFLGAGSGF